MKKSNKTKEFNACVSEAKKVVALLRLKNRHRIRVAELAVKACAIYHGGRAPVTRLTLRAFAEKIGVNPHTLYEWIRYKRVVYDNLNAQNKNLYNDISADTLKYVVTAVGTQNLRNADKKKINRVFLKHAKMGPVVSKLVKYGKVMDTIIYNLSNYSRSHEIPDDILNEYEKKARQIVAYTEKLKAVRGGKVKPLTKKELDLNWDNFWENEVRNVQA